MVNFPNIENNWNALVHRTVECLDNANDLRSIKGRGICLIHTLATPLKAANGLGRLAYSIIDIAARILLVITFNAYPEKLIQAGANVLDVIGGSVLLIGALFANIIRGLAGTVVHPGAMIHHTDIPSYAAKHNILYGTLVNY